MPKGYSEGIRKQARSLMESNHTNREISDILGVSTVTIAKWRKTASIPNSTKAQGARIYSKEIKEEATNLLKEGMTISGISQLLDIPRNTIHYWAEKQGIKVEKRIKTAYTIDDTNNVIDLIREGNTLAEISEKTGVKTNNIKKIRDDEIREGNPLPPFKVGISRKQKYSDEEVIDLVYQNPGYGLNRFAIKLGISKKFLMELSLDFKEFTEGNEDLISILQDEKYGRMISDLEFMKLAGIINPDTPSRGLSKNIYLPPQEFIWGDIKEKIWGKNEEKELNWIRNRVKSHGYVTNGASSLEVGEKKFKKLLRKAGLVYHQKTNAWYDLSK